MIRKNTSKSEVKYVTMYILTGGKRGDEEKERNGNRSPEAHFYGAVG